MLGNSYQCLEKELKDWMNEPYQTNPNYRDKLNCKTRSKLVVRSKSESTIADMLAEKGIPFRYECALILNGKTYYPDFLLRHPKSGKYCYYEHLGLMEDPNYLRKSVNKIRIYGENNIIIGKNLIITSETEDNPLDPNYVQMQLEYFLEAFERWKENARKVCQ